MESESGHIASFVWLVSWSGLGLSLERGGHTGLGHQQRPSLSGPLLLAVCPPG